MEGWTIAGVGFGSAVLGALAAFSGSLYLLNRANSARRHGVITALLAELLMNSQHAVAFVAGRQWQGTYSGAVWDKAVFEIAQFASRPLLAELIFVYGNMHVAERASKKPEPSDTDWSSEIVRSWYEGIRTAYNMLLQDPRIRRTTSEWKQMRPFQSALDEALSRIS